MSHFVLELGVEEIPARFLASLERELGSRFAALFEENGIFSQEVAESFRENILSRGGSEHPKVLYRRFRGQDATIDALMKRDGIK